MTNKGVPRKYINIEGYIFGSEKKNVRICGGSK